MLLFALFIALSNFFLFANADCVLNCAAGQTCYARGTEAMNCLRTVPFNEEWAVATLDVLSESLENFGFAALYHETGPPYSISLDVQGELSDVRAMVLSGMFATDVDFQERVQRIFQATLDAHTRYQKPACYNAVFLQPFSFDLRVVESTEPTALANEPSLFLMRNLYTDQYAAQFPDVDVSSLFGKEVSLLNGVEFTTEIAGWGDAYETRSNNAGVRFNAAVRSYLYRSAIATNVVPLEDLVVTFADGAQTTLPWMASYGAGLADVSVCAAKTTAERETETERETLLGAHRDSSYPELLSYAAPLHDETLRAARPDRTVIVPTTAPYPVTCFTQTVSGDDARAAGVQSVLVMKVSSFSPDGPYLEAWQGFLDQAKTCLSAQFDLLVVDVMQNGGGYVCLGLRLVELLVEDYYNDHTLVQMHYDLPHSALMDKYIDAVNAPNPYPYPQDVEQILDRDTQAAFPDGRAYYYPGRNVTQGGVTSWRTNWFSLNCTQAEAMPAGGAWRPPRFMTPDKLVIMTDGTCGSTCASFTKIPQEDNRATFVGVGGLWDQPMDVSSFAGGFVCNPNYLANIAAWAGTTFPKFLTNQRWQFGWAAWYSAKLPTRPVQFTAQDPQYRQAFWGFPHASIDATVTTAMVSTLYDRVIASTLDRLAAAVPVTQSCGDDKEKTYLVASLATVSVLLACAVAALMYVFVFAWPKRSYSLANADDEHNPLQQGLVSP